MLFRPGRAIGPYEVLSVLGSGAMGTVYLARDRRLDRKIALKFLHTAGSSSDGADARDRVLSEARSASPLNQPNNGHVYDVGEADGEPWIAMEYVEGRPLRSLIVVGGLPPSTVLRISVQIAGALAHAHEHAIVHRDLKSANIVCDRDWGVKLLDSGIATRPPEAIAEELTQSRASLGSRGPAGTPAYMAPELLRGQPADQRTDLWSLGVLLHELLTGQLPFSGRTGFELASAILQNPPPPLPVSTPEPLAGVGRRPLSKEPRNRFRHAGELRAVLESLQESATRVNRVRRRIRTIVFAALAIALAGGTAFTCWRATGHRPLTLSEQRLISTTEGSHRAPSCSPDGSMVAFAAADVDGVSQIWIKNLAQGDPIKITSGSEPAERPRWSPKNDQILNAVTGQ